MKNPTTIFFSKKPNNGLIKFRRAVLLIPTNEASNYIWQKDIEWNLKMKYSLLFLFTLPYCLYDFGQRANKSCNLLFVICRVLYAPAWDGIYFSFPQGRLEQKKTSPCFCWHLQRNNISKRIYNYFSSCYKKNAILNILKNQEKWTELDSNCYKIPMRFLNFFFSAVKQMWG